MSLKKFINSMKIVDFTEEYFNPETTIDEDTRTKGAGWEMKAWKLCCVPGSIRRLDLGPDAESVYALDICTCSALILDVQWLRQFVPMKDLPQYLDNMFAGVSENTGSIMLRSVAAILSQYCYSIFSKDYRVKTGTGKLSKVSNKVCFPVCVDANGLAENLIRASIQFYVDRKTSFVQGGNLKDAAFSYIFQYLVEQYGVVYLSDWFLDASSVGWWLDQMEFVRANTVFSVEAVKNNIKKNTGLFVSKDSEEGSVTVFWSDPDIIEEPRTAADDVDVPPFLDESVSDEYKVKQNISVLKRNSMAVVGDLNSGVCFKMAVPWRMVPPSDYLEDCVIVNIQYPHETDLIYDRIKKAVLDISVAKTNDRKKSGVR